MNNLNKLPRLHYSLAITIDRSVPDYTLSSDISITLVFSVPGVSSCCNSIAYMLSPTIANISATTTVAITAVAATAAAAAVDTTTAGYHSTNPTTVAKATTNSVTGTTVRPVYPKFGLFQFNYCMHCVSLVRM